MSNTTGKRGFVPVQPAASISVLDFAARLSAYRAACEANAAVDADYDAVSLPVYQAMVDAQSALIATPVRQTDLIAAKVQALYHRFGGEQGSDLSDAKTQAAIMDLNPRPLTEDDASQCLLSVYLDLTAASRDRAAWATAIQAVDAAWAEVEAINARERETNEDCSDEWHVAWQRHSEALEALLNTRAPDGEAMGLKARLVIEKALSDWASDGPDNPDTLSRLMGDGTWAEHALAALYQDGLAFAGVVSPAALAQPESFDGVAWVQEAEASFGVAFATRPQKAGGLTASGGCADAALAAFAALAVWKQHEAWDSVRAREEAARQEAGRAVYQPTPPAQMRAMFLRGLLNTYEDAGEREAMRADLASIGITPVVWEDEQEAAQPLDPAAFVADLLAADMTVGAKTDGRLTELLYSGDKPRHANAGAMRDRFHALTASERDALAAHIAGLGK